MARGGVADVGGPGVTGRTHGPLDHPETRRFHGTQGHPGAQHIFPDEKIGISLTAYQFPLKAVVVKAEHRDGLCADIDVLVETGFAAVRDVEVLFSALYAGDARPKGDIGARKGTGMHVEPASVDGKGCAL